MFVFAIPHRLRRTFPQCRGPLNQTTVSVAQHQSLAPGGPDEHGMEKKCTLASASKMTGLESIDVIDPEHRVYDAVQTDHLADLVAREHEALPRRVKIDVWEWRGQLVEEVRVPLRSNLAGCRSLAPPDPFTERIQERAQSRHDLLDDGFQPNAFRVSPTRRFSLVGQ